MRRGDISSKSLPRLLVIWEGLLAKLPDAQAMRARDRYLKRGKYRQALDCYVTDSIASARLHQAYWRYDMPIDIVTFLGPEMRDELEERLNRERLSFGWVLSETEDSLASRVGWDQSIGVVLDPQPERYLRWGSKGGLILDPRVQGFVS